MKYKDLHDLILHSSTTRKYFLSLPVSVDLGAASEDDKIKEQLMLLEDAIEEKYVVHFSYTNSHDDIKDIQVEPVCLQYKWYNWYLIGYYEKYQDYCMFKLVRMDNLQTTNIKFTTNHKLSDLKMKDNTKFADPGNLSFQVDAIAYSAIKS